MKFWTKSLNIVLFCLVLLLFLLLKERIHLSSNLSAFLPENQSKTLLDIYAKFNHTTEVFIASEGFDKASLKRIKTLEEKLTRSSYLELKSDILPNTKRLDYQHQNAFYLKTFQPKPSNEIAPTLKTLYEGVLHNPFYTTIDPYDPLGYFSAPHENRSILIRNAHLALGDFGYLSIFKLNPHQTEQNYEELYHFVHENIKGFDNIRLFSPAFYFVENAQKIKSDVTLLVCVSSLLLALLYLLFLKNIGLLFNTLLSLASSVMLSFILLSFIWSDISLFVLAFGSAISTVAIDYMFHHYLHGHYEKPLGFNKTVFFGFFTTLGGFFIFGFVDFLLIQQLCLFSMLSLTFSYLHFAFIYPIIGFCKAPDFTFFKRSFVLPYRLITLVSLLIIIATLPFVRINTNLRSLDYHNQKLLRDELFFKQQMKEVGTTPILIEAQSLDTLVEKSRLIAQKSPNALLPLSFLIDKKSFEAKAKVFKDFDFDSTQKIVLEEAKKQGFRDNFFQHAYHDSLLHPTFTPITHELLDSMGIHVLTHQGVFYTLGMVKANDIAMLETQNLAHSMEAQTLFSKALASVQKELMWCGILSATLLCLVLLWICPNALMLCLSFILFPIALILLSLLGKSLSLMHLFMLFIVMALSIDYGIYKADTKAQSRATHNAIFFSLLSTFAGFGVLIFSRIGALEHIGWVASVGVFALFLLLLGREKQ